MYTETVTLRTTLLLGCVVTVALAAWVGNPAPYLDSGFALGRLLRAMAVIKAGVVLAAISLLWWRFKRPVAAHLAAACLISTWLAAGASMLIWQLTAIPLAALTFHAGGLAFLVAAWRDHRASAHAPEAWSLFKGRR
ncbi:MAG: hypothetical protein CFE40_10815 [Burkholderiales bacterium PBB1]|nr:MAG: hypothetical protein CFE40_10815 [Burkholderiales bacterium PBB1]